MWHQQSKAAWAFCQQIGSCPLKWLHFLISVANFSTKNIVFYSCYILSRLEQKEQAWVLLPHPSSNCSAARPISLSLKERTLFPSFWQINLVMICPVQFSVFQASTGEQVKIWCMKGILVICWEREWFFQQQLSPHKSHIWTWGVRLCLHALIDTHNYLPVSSSILWLKSCFPLHWYGFHRLFVS